MPSPSRSSSRSSDGYHPHADRDGDGDIDAWEGDAVERHIHGRSKPRRAIAPSAPHAGDPEPVAEPTQATRSIRPLQRRPDADADPAVSVRREAGVSLRAPAPASAIDLVRATKTSDPTEAAVAAVTADAAVGHYLSWGRTGGRLKGVPSVVIEADVEGWDARFRAASASARKAGSSRVQHPDGGPMIDLDGPEAAKRAEEARDLYRCRYRRERLEEAFRAGGGRIALPVADVRPDGQRDVLIATNLDKPDERVKARILDLCSGVDASGRRLVDASGKPIKQQHFSITFTGNEATSIAKLAKLAGHGHLRAGDDVFQCGRVRTLLGQSAQVLGDAPVGADGGRLHAEDRAALLYGEIGALQTVAKKIRSAGAGHSTIAAGMSRETKDFMIASGAGFGAATPPPAARPKGTMGDTGDRDADRLGLGAVEAERVKATGMVVRDLTIPWTEDTWTLGAIGAGGPDSVSKAMENIWMAKASTSKVVVDVGEEAIAVDG